MYVWMSVEQTLTMWLVRIVNIMCQPLYIRTYVKQSWYVRITCLVCVW